MSSEPKESVDSAAPRAAEQAVADSAAESQTTGRKPRRLWRWTKRATLALLLIAVVARFALPPLLPKLLEGPLGERGLALDWERLDLSVFGGHLELQHVDLWAGERSEGPPVDGSGLAHVEFLLADVDMSALLRGKLRVHRLEIDGADLRMERDANGKLDWLQAFAGDGAPDDEEDEEENGDPDDEGPRGLLDALPENLDFPIELGAARLQHVRLTFVDQASDVQVPTTELQLRLSDFGHDRRDGRFSFNASSSGLLDRLRVEGPVRFVEHGGETPETPAVVGLDVDLKLELLGLRPGTVAPLLAELGVEARADTLDAGGGLRLSVGPGRRIALGAQALRLSADGETAAGLEALEFVAEQADTGGVLEVSAARVSGGDLFATREADGNVAFAGLAFVGASEPGPAGEPSASTPEEAPKEASAETTSEPGPLPRVRLPELRLSDLTATFDDRASAPPTQLVADLETLSLRQLELGTSAPPPVRLEILAHLPGVLSDLRASGELEPFIEQPHARLDFSGSGLDLDALEPYLAAAGVESQWENGELRGQVDVRTASQGDQLVLAAEVSDLHLGSAALGEVAGLERLSVGGLRATESGLELERLEVAGATLALELDPQGPWRALGLGSAPPTVMDDPTADQSEPQYESLGLTAGALTLSDMRLGADVVSAQLAGSLGVGDWIERLSIDVGLDGSPQALGADVSVDLDGWSGETLARFLGVEAPEDGSAGSARVRGRVQWDQGDGVTRANASFDTLELAPPPLVAGTAPRLSADTLQVEVELLENDGVQRVRLVQDIAGIEASEWAGYLPEGIDLDLTGAQLASAWTAELGSQSLPAVEATESTPAVAAEEATTLRIALERSGLFDAQGAMLVGFDSLEVSAPLLAARELNLERIAVRGGRLRASRDAEGVLHLPGLRIAPGEAAADAPAAGGVPTGEADGVAGSGRGGLPPRVWLGALELELAELRFEDALQPEAAPLVLTAGVQSSEPWLVFDLEAEQQAELPLAVTFGVAPALESGRVDLRLSPFDDQPSVQAAVLLEGLSAAGALALAPQLAERLNATELTDGVFRAELGAALDLRRRGPLDFDLSQGFGAEFEVRDVELRGAPDAEPLLGLEALRVEASKLQPTTGDFRIRSIEVQRPQARFARRPEGIELAGVLLKQAVPPVAEDVDEAVEDANEVVEATTEPLPTVESSPAKTPEADPVRLSVGELVASGLDLYIEDTTGKVPMILPLNELDFELRGLDTGAPSKLIRFNLLVGSGEVQLPERAPEKNLVSGLAGFAVDVLDGSTTKERALESRRVFEDLTVSGQVQLGGPGGDGPPTGWTQVNVTGFELLAARGPAGASGVTITDGVMDLSAKARLRGVDGLRLDTKTTLGNLALSEPADGPISQWLKLPAPLDSVIFLMKDNAGEITLPFNLVMDEKGLSIGRLAGEAVAALTQIIATAVASSPLRVAGGLTDFLGLGGGGEEAQKLEEFRIQFPVGLDLLTPEQVGRIALVAQRFRSNGKLVGVVTHVLGQGDLDRAEALGNPSPAAREDLHHRLSARRQELERQRTELAAEIRSQWMVGLAAEAEVARRRLELIDAELLAAENALDRVLELLSPRAERNRERRTRQIALAMAELRLAELQRRLDEAGLPADIDERLRIQLPRFRVDESLEAGGALEFTLKP